MIDDRENLPSISQFERIALCPSSWLLGQKVSEPTSGPAAEYGTQVHRAMETGETDNLTDDQRDLVDAMSEQEALLIKDLFGKRIPSEEFRERRFWYQLRLKGIQPKNLFSGKLDFCAWSNGHERVSLYVDYKSLWGDTTPPPHNLQLRGGAVLMKQDFGSRRAFVAICQPNKHKLAIAAEYGLEEIEQAESECIKIIERAMASDSRPIPGPDQCRYCRAKLICKVAHKESIENIAQFEDISKLKNASIDRVVTSLTDCQLDDIGWRWEIAQIIGKTIDAEIRRRKEDNPESMPNYQFVSTGYSSEIEHPAVVFPKFASILSKEEFSRSCSVLKGKLEKAVQNVTGKKMSECKRLVDQTLGDLLIRKAKKPSLQRKPYYEIT